MICTTARVTVIAVNIEQTIPIIRVTAKPLIGTGPIKGFAVTLMIGIVCSMFTAITVTRAVVQLIYGKKRNLKKLSI